MKTENSTRKENLGLIKKLRRSKTVVLGITLATAMYFSPACSKESESNNSNESENSWTYEGIPTSQPANEAELKEQQRVYHSNPALWWATYGNRGYMIPGHPYYPGNPLYDGHIRSSGSSGVVHDSGHSGKSSSSSTKSVTRGGFGSSGKSSTS